MVCEIPRDWRDVSDIRQVPDHQEVWQSMNGEVLVIEILERQEVGNKEAARFFFSDLAESNGATQVGTSLFQSSTTPPTTAVEGAIACAGVGFQKIAIGKNEDIAGRPRKDQEVQWTSVELLVLRLPRVETDLLVTLTKPAPNPSEPPVNAPVTPEWSSNFQKVLSTLKVRDWGLFG